MRGSVHQADQVLLGFFQAQEGPHFSLGRVREGFLEDVMATLTLEVHLERQREKNG